MEVEHEDETNIELEITLKENDSRYFIVNINDNELKMSIGETKKLNLEGIIVSSITEIDPPLINEGYI